MALQSDFVDDSMYADAFEPPAGTRFRSGLIVTLALSYALADIVAPALPGVASDDAHR